jgi:hypothetical protein
MIVSSWNATSQLGPILGLQIVDAFCPYTWKEGSEPIYGPISSRKEGGDEQDPNHYDR